MRFPCYFAVAIIGCAAHGQSEATRILMSQPMPPLDGAQVRVTLVEVRYAPGGGSAPHRHTCPVIGFVMEGALRTQMRGGPPRIYRAGESFYEGMDQVHEVSANASNIDPARFLATFVCDHTTPRTLAADSLSGTTP